MGRGTILRLSALRSTWCASACALVLLFGADGCSKKPAPASFYGGGGPSADKPEPLETRAELRAAPVPQQLASANTSASRGATDVTPVPSTRKLIRHGTLGLEVRSVESALSSVRQQAQSTGGYTTEESQRQDEYGVKTASITWRVPAEKLDAAMERLKALGRVEQVSVTAEDVTEQYFDVEIRLNNQRQLEARLLDLLKRSSNNLSDLLNVEREVARVRGEIEQLEGRKRFWDNQVALSTLTVNLHEPRPVIAGREGGMWRTLGASFRDAGDNFVLATAGIIGVIGGLIPVVIVLVLVIWALRRLWRWRRKRHATAASV